MSEWDSCLDSLFVVGSISEVQFVGEFSDYVSVNNQELLAETPHR